MRKCYVLLLAAVMLTALAAPAGAGVPRLLSYQGVLTDNLGAAVADGTYQLTFNIYDVASGGSTLWTEVQNVDVTGGVFTAMLGSVTTLSIPFDVEYYLGITVESDPELAPRVQLCGAPYALSADMLAGSANIVPSTGDAGFGTTEPQHKVHIVDTGHDDVVLDIRSTYGSGEYRVQTDENVNNFMMLSKGASGAAGSTAGLPLANMSRLAAGNAAGPMMLQVMITLPG